MRGKSNVSLKALFLGIIFCCSVNLVAQTNSQSTVLDVDFEKLISRADLQYDKQVRISEEGMPAGNGVMGSLVWTTPKQLRLQINRVDVFAADSKTNSFPEVDSDYSHGCAFVDIDFGGYGHDVFPPDNTLQHLSVYDGTVEVEGQGVKVDVFAWPDGDVMALQITDNRNNPASIRVTLRTLRRVNYKQRNHYAFTRVGSAEDKIFLSQQFVEGDDIKDRWMELAEQEAHVIENRIYYCASSVAAAVSGRETQVKHLNDGMVQLAVKPGKGTFTLLLSSASNFDIDENINSKAIAELDKAIQVGENGLKEASKKWWHNFWSNSFIHMSSEDGVAEYVEKHYTYFLYLMASSSRGDYPPRYGGMIWNTGADARMWGSMKWMYNLFCYFNNVLYAANKIDITNSVFSMVNKNYDAHARAAGQMWGSKGIYLPETMWFNGPSEMPEDIAAEMRDLYLVRKPFSEASEKFLYYAAPKNAFDAQWSWKMFEEERWVNGHYKWKPRPSAPYTYVLHLFASGANIAYYHWLRYDYTRDIDWLREYGYPVIKGVAEFYRNYPKVVKKDDGKYHIIGVNNWESTWGSSDTIEELAGMKAVTATVLRASEILGVDEDMRPVWKEFLDNITPLPTAPDTSREGNPRMWVSTTVPSHEDAIEGRGVILRRSTTPATKYDLFTKETSDQEMIELAKNSYIPYTIRVEGSRGVGWLSKAAITAATMGDAGQIKYLVPNQIKYQGLEEGYPELGAGWGSNWRGPLANRMSLAEGRQAMGAQRIGNAAEGLVLALCRAAPPGPAGETVISVFPAWPKEWNAEFTLLARGNFLVTSSVQNGEIEFIEVLSKSGGECRVRNPWGEISEVSLYNNGKEIDQLKGSLLKFDTSKGENFIIVRSSTTPDDYKRNIDLN